MRIKSSCDTQTLIPSSLIVRQLPEGEDWDYLEVAVGGKFVFPKYRELKRQLRISAPILLYESLPPTFSPHTIRVDKKQTNTSLNLLILIFNSPVI